MDGGSPTGPKLQTIRRGLATTTGSKLGLEGRTASSIVLVAATSTIATSIIIAASIVLGIPILGAHHTPRSAPIRCHYPIAALS